MNAEIWGLSASQTQNYLYLLLKLFATIELANYCYQQRLEYSYERFMCPVMYLRLNSSFTINIL